MLVGISSFAGYIPRYRINRMQIFSAMGWLNPAIIMNAAGDKAVANYDEDSITMAVAAGMKCMQGFNPADIEALYFASTTAPYRERQNANIISGALAAGETIRTADFSGSVKSGTAALLSAIEFVASGSGRNAMACASDCRIGKVGSVQEMVFGDGGAALLISCENVLAEFKGAFSMACDFVDHLRGENSKYDRQWEERWIRDMGYDRFIPQAIQGLCDKYSLQIADFKKVIYPCYYGGARKNINRRLKIDSEQVQDDLMMDAGDTGSAHPLLMLAASLEDASPGDKIAVISYGNGCDALYFEVTGEIENYKNRLRVTDSIRNRQDLDNFQKYLAWREMLPVEIGMRGEEERLTRWSLVWRNRKAISSMQGTKCLACGTQQYPPQRVCVNPECGAIDQMVPIILSGKTGKIVSFTSDMLAATLNPPAIYGNIDFEGGGRLMMDFTDCVLEDLKVGIKVNFSFRIKYVDPKRDTTFYFWKAVPAKEVS
ncbi:MAG: OB-fold domain-containing protein [Bacillota bacterium]|nr:OB-fold domain-containing protein [Bacillota bacterium]